MGSPYKRCLGWSLKPTHYLLRNYIATCYLRFYGYMREHFVHCLHMHRVRHVKFFFFFSKLVLISRMVTLRSWLIWQIISFILPPNEYGWVYAWTTLGSGPAIDLQKMPILAKKYHLIRWRSIWSWRVCKHVKLPHLGHRKSARKTSHFLARILIQRHNWAIFLRK